MTSNLGRWEQRWHPLRQEWVVYSAHRNTRPWSGASAPAPQSKPAYDPQCYLCPGNARVNGKQNPDYKDIFVFDNDLPVVGPDAPTLPPDWLSAHNGLYQRRPANGLARVICYDPRHHVTLAQISLAKVTGVFRTWREQMIELQSHPEVEFVLIFENRGEIVGVSNPHPHCQLYATNFTFSLIEKEMNAVEEYRRATGRNLFESVLEAELCDEIRIIAENKSACAFIPFFARYAYEMLIFPKKRHATLATLSDEEVQDLADVFQQVIRRYDLLFDMPFPYVMAVYQAPIRGFYPDYHLHLLLQPPLRQPGLQKFPAGPEIGGGNFMADTIPEEKAQELRLLDLSRYQSIDAKP